MEQSIRIRHATQADLKEIVLVHQLAFPGFFLTQLGPQFLMLYYGLVLQFKGGILLIAEQDGKIVGFVAGFLEPEQFYRRMTHHKLHFVIPILWNILRRPGNLPRVLNRVRRVKQWQIPIDIDCELSSIGVRKEFSGIGIGKQLVRTFLEEAAKRGAKGVYLTTDAVNNEGVNRFYQNLGFRLTRTFTVEEGRLMNEYVFRFIEHES